MKYVQLAIFFCGFLLEYLIKLYLRNEGYCLPKKLQKKLMWAFILG